MPLKRDWHSTATTAPTNARYRLVNEDRQASADLSEFVGLRYNELARPVLADDLLSIVNCGAWRLLRWVPRSDRNAPAGLHRRLCSASSSSDALPLLSKRPRRQSRSDAPSILRWTAESIHSVEVTPANIHDSHVLPWLLHGDERRDPGDPACASPAAALRVGWPH